MNACIQATEEGCSSIFSFISERLREDPRFEDAEYPPAIPVENGGLALRRSVWKKNPVWQYCTVNLNVQMLSAELVAFESANVKELRTVVPTVTFGCAAAHKLKYHEGGLRRQFMGIRDSANRLDWMHVLQVN